MKIVINSTFGGFSLSRKAVKRIAEIQDRPCYFYKIDIHDTRLIKEDEKAFVWTAMDIDNLTELIAEIRKQNLVPYEHNGKENAIWQAHEIDNRPKDRADKILVRVVEELGPEANGRVSALKVIEIPDDVKWHIEEYDGLEHVAEDHRIWD